MRIMLVISLLMAMFLGGCTSSKQMPYSHGMSGLDVQVIEVRQFEDGGLGGTYLVHNTLDGLNHATPFHITARILKSDFVSDAGITYRVVVLATPESQKITFGPRMDFKVYDMTNKETRQFPLFGGKFVALHDDAGKMPDHGTRMRVVSHDTHIHIHGDVEIQRIRR